MRRVCLEHLLLLLFSLQVLAVGIEAIPQATEDPLSRVLQKVWRPLTRPYVRVTAQWQNWSLFAPDPLREAVTLSVDVWTERAGTWLELWTIAPGMLPSWRETALLKVARALSEERPKYFRSRQEFLQRLCRRFGIPGEGKLRLRMRSSDLSQPSAISEVVRAEAVCSSSS